MRGTWISRFATGLQSRFEGWCEVERGRFALWLPVAMSAGVVAYFELKSEPPLWSAAAPLLGAITLAVGVRAWRVAFAACLVVAALALGFGSARFATWRAPPTIEVPARATIVSGTIRAVEILPAGRRVILGPAQFDDGPVLPRAIRVTLRAPDDRPLQTGDRIAVRALLQRPAPPAVPGGWDLQRDAWFSGLGAVGRALNPWEMMQAGPASGAGWLQRLRETIAGRVAGVLSGAAGAIATTLLTGTTTGIPAPDRAAFRDSGLAHLLAIAGLHIGIVMGLIFGATRFTLALSERAALFWPLKSIAAATALAAGGAYLLLTGGHVPIIRSFAMASLVTLGVLAGRRAISLRALALAMACIVLLAPNEVVGVSFQMSFSAVLALIVGYAMLRGRLAALHGDGSRWRRVVGHVTALALTSALAGTFSAPYGAYHFGHVQLYYVLANMVAVPLTAMLVMPAGLIGLALMPVHLEQLALVPMGWGIGLIIRIAHAVSDLPQATVAVPHMPAWGLAVFSVGLAWFGIWRSRIRMAGLAAMLVGLLSSATATPPDILMSADGRLIGYREASVFLLQKASGGSGFVQDSWQQYWAAPPPIPLECASSVCLLQPRVPGTSALLLHGAAEPGQCGADLLISAEPIRLRCPEKILLVDRFSVWRRGAHAIWLGRDRVTILSDREDRGERPWVLALPLAGRIPTGTTPALAEILPPE
jgi:competence protein ComEC